MQIDKAIVQAKLRLVIARAEALKPLEDEALLAKANCRSGNAVGLFAQDFGMKRWDWPQGVGLYGMYRLYEITGEQDLKLYLKNWYARHMDKGLPSRNINTTAPMLTLAHLCQTGEMGPECTALCKDWATWLLKDLPRTAQNGFQHTTTGDAALGTITMHENELWIDTLFMAVLFLAQYGAYSASQAHIQESIAQYLIHIQYLFSKRDGLFYHGWSFNRLDNFGGVYWCRGNSWFTSATVDWLEALGTLLGSGTRRYVKDIWLTQVQTLAGLQGKSGLWNTILDDPNSYQEVSGSAGIAYGILKGIRTGLLPQTYYPCARRAVSAILDNIAEDGTVLNVSAGTGMGDGPEHYQNILRLPMAYGQSLAALALTEALRIPD